MDNNLTFLNACRSGQKGIVQIFLKKGGIDVNKRDAEGNTPLHYACLKGFRDIVNLLLENKADATAVNNLSETPLHAAARTGNKEIIERLLDCGSDINATDKDGKTPLMCLADNRRTDAAIRLIERGADTSLTDNDGHTALDYATAHGLKSLVAKLAEGQEQRDEPAKDASGNTLLHQAAYNNQGEVIRTLLATASPMLDARNDRGETPLAIACAKNNLMIARMLIEAGADVNKGLMNGNTPLHFAAWTGNKFLGAALLAAKAQTDRQNENGDTPLTMAAREGDADFVELLIEAGADVNMAENLQHTALHYAAERGYNQIVEMLLAAGAEG